VYISSHGYSFGDMSGDSNFAFPGIQELFVLAKAVASGQFSGPDWLLLSTCSTLNKTAQPSWLKVMTGTTPLRGIVGYLGPSPLSDDSADIASRLIQELASGKTFVEAWRAAVRSKTTKAEWAVLCHENAQKDTIADLNANRVKPIPASGSKVLAFSEANPKGTEVREEPDPFDAFWSKGGTVITPANRTAAANQLAAGDDVTITVRLPNPSRTPTVPIQFVDKTVISITLIYIRPDYPQDVDVNALFSVTGVTGAAQRSPNPTAHLNRQRPAGHDKEDDSWILVVSGTPTEVVLRLKCISLSTLHDHGIPLRLEVNIGSEQFLFAQNGVIRVP
jgi:hypothetical protein